MTDVATVAHDPRRPESEEEVLESLGDVATMVIQFCEAQNVTTPTGLQDAPTDVQRLLTDHARRPLILKYLHWRKSKAGPAGPVQVREYADKEELERMSSCHQRCIEVLKLFLGAIRPRALFRALDVAGGDGRLACSFLLKHFGKVDLFDQCHRAVGLAQQRMQRNGATGFVQQATMQNFSWPFQYSAVFMVWCAGYLPSKELVAFLSKAKANLSESAGRFTRLSTPESFIFLLDNVLGEDEEPEMEKGQRVRSQEQLEAIFEEAGLIVHRCSERQAMPEGYRDVVLWALY